MRKSAHLSHGESVFPLSKHRTCDILSGAHFSCLFRAFFVSPCTAARSSGIRLCRQCAHLYTNYLHRNVRWTLAHLSIALRWIFSMSTFLYCIMTIYDQIGIPMRKAKSGLISRFFFSFSDSLGFALCAAQGIHLLICFLCHRIRK